MSTSPARWDWRFGLLAWIDVETTGILRPGLPAPELLEVALFVTDADLNAVLWCQAVIAHDSDKLAALDMHPVARDMHTKNGLLEECSGPAAITIPAAEMLMITTLDEALRAHPEHENTPVTWAGWSPSALDRPMLTEHMPTFYKRIHYRTYDLSAVKLGMINNTGMTFPEKDEVHRAHPDNLEAVREARRIRDYLSVLSKPAQVA